MKAALRHVEFTFDPARDGYLTGRTNLFGAPFDVEAFRVQKDTWNMPDGGRGRRLQETLEGLLIDDVPLQPVQIPGIDGWWLVFVYPGEDSHYKGELP